MASKKKFNAGQVEQIQLRFGLPKAQISKLPESKVRSVLRKLDNRDRPRSRVEYARKSEVDDDGKIPANAVENAQRQLDSARARAAFKPMSAGVPCGMRVVPGALFAAPVLVPGAGVAPNQWKSIGPGNIGGRTRAIVVDPANANRVWVASAGGGVWNTDDGGASWSPVNDMMANLAVCCLAQDPSDPKVIYAGTGEGFNNVDAIRGAGIFVTTDQSTWNQIPATNSPQFHFVNRIAISKNGKVMLAATSNSSGAPGAFGIFRSDDVARSTWTRVLNEQIGDVKFNPTNNLKAVAGGLRNGEAYFSIDGGQTWTEATHAGVWSGRVELTYAVQDPSIVYASLDMNGGEIWRSTNDGKSYQKRDSKGLDGNASNYLGGQGWYDNAIWAGDPTDSNMVIVGGIDLWRSTNGGKTLGRISNWTQKKSAHADHHAIVSSPGYNGTTNKVVFFGNDGGVYRTDDVSTVGDNNTQTKGWVNLVNGYGVTQFYGGAGHAATGTIIGGAQDNGTLAFSVAGGSNAWIEIQGGDGGYCASDPGDSKRFYGEYVHLGIFRNTDGATSDANWWENYINGQFWNPSLPTPDWDWKPIPFRIVDAMLQDALFIAPFMLDPNDSNRMLAGGNSLWRTNDVKTPNTNTKGPSWTAVKAGIGSGVSISAIAIAQGNSEIVWVGYENGEVAATTNGTTATPAWKIIGRSGGSQLQPRRFCTRIVINPQDHKVVYVLFGGYTAGNIWMTRDSGATWANIGASLPDAPVRTLAIHPRKSEFLYLGSEVGVFTSEDAGATWSPTNEGPTNCSVNELFWMNETLVCVTHGRGMFKIDLSGI